MLSRCAPPWSIGSPSLRRGPSPDGGNATDAGSGDISDTARLPLSRAVGVADGLEFMLGGARLVLGFRWWTSVAGASVRGLTSPADHWRLLTATAVWDGSSEHE